MLDGAKQRIGRWEDFLDPNGPRSVFGVLCKPFKRMAGTTGLEPAASAVTGQRSNQLNYVPNFVFLPLSETRFFTGFPQVQSIRLRRLFQPRRTEFRG